VRWVWNLTWDLEIPGLRAYGLDPEHLDSVCERAAAARSMRGNPVELGWEALRRVLVASL
jgi:alcohol dehydrogenase class IV